MTGQHTEIFVSVIRVGVNKTLIVIEGLLDPQLFFAKNWLTANNTNA